MPIKTIISALTGTQEVISIASEAPAPPSQASESINIKKLKAILLSKKVITNIAEIE